MAALIAGDTLSYSSIQPVETVTEHSILERVAIQVVLDDLENVEIVVTDSHVAIIDLEKHEAYYSENNSWDDNSQLVVYRKREETDLEFTKRKDNWNKMGET